MRSPLRLSFPPELTDGLHTFKTWPPDCDHKIPFAQPVWVKGDAVDFLTQSFDGSDYRVDVRSFTTVRPISLLMKVDCPFISIAIGLKGLIEVDLGRSIHINIEQRKYSVIYMPKGEKQIRLGVGDLRWICIIPPATYLKSIAGDDGTIKSIIDHWQKRLDDSVVLPLMPLSEKMQHLLKRMTTPIYTTVTLDLELRRLMLEALTFYSMQIKTKFGKGTGPLSAHGTVVAVREYIMANLGDVNLGGLNEMAALFHTNTKSLNKAFATLTGKSISRFIHDERLEWAKQLLEKKEMRVFEIAAIVGFSDTANFIRRFKKKFGYTPLHRNIVKRSGNTNKNKL